jgi:hypothetical protein
MHMMIIRTKMNKLPKIKKSIRGYGTSMPNYLPSLPALPWLPAKIPQQKKINLAKSKKKKKYYDMFEDMLAEKRQIRAEKIKKIAWKKVDDNEYEIVVKGLDKQLPIGHVKRCYSTKWTIHPSFRTDVGSLRYIIAVKEEYLDSHEAGRSLAELWVIS